jgi:hypothetical protein
MRLSLLLLILLQTYFVTAQVKKQDTIFYGVKSMMANLLQDSAMVNISFDTDVTGRAGVLHIDSFVCVTCTKKQKRYYTNEALKYVKRSVNKAFEKERGSQPIETTVVVPLKFYIYTKTDLSKEN